MWMNHMKDGRALKTSLSWRRQINQTISNQFQKKLTSASGKKKMDKTSAVMERLWHLDQKNSQFWSMGN